MFDIHRQNLYKQLQSDAAFLKGGVSSCWYDSDTDIKFRQESNFVYLTGCHEPDCCALFDGADKSFTLFVPNLGAEHELWMGKLLTREQQAEMYQPTKILYLEEMQAVLEQLKGRKVHIINDVPQISNHQFPAGLELVNDLQPMVAELRVIKDEKEIQELRESCAINAKAFNYVMCHFKEGMMEYQAEAMHTYMFMKHGARFPSFNAITAAGANASTLHFVNNVHQAKAGQVFELDAGCELRNSCSDHTRTFPVSSRFTKRQEELYTAVLESQKAGLAAAKPGVAWEDVHFAALKQLLVGLRKAGIVRAEFDIEEQHRLGVASIFQPHGVGHMLGLNTHDVGGYNSEIKKNTQDHRIKYLRTRRVLKPGMVLTVEPGLYFIDGFINAAKQNPEMAKHINFEVLEQYRAEFGGCRIEDDIVITETGIEILPGPVKELTAIYALRDAAYCK